MRPGADLALARRRPPAAAAARASVRLAQVRQALFRSRAASRALLDSLAGRHLGRPATHLIERGGPRMAARTIHRAQHNFGWDNSFEPAIRVAPGEALTFEVTDASSGQYTQSTTSADVPKLDFARVNPVVGPVFVEGAQPGDALLVEILDLKESGWGWTAVIPGFGLLADDFPDPAYHLSRYSPDGVEFEPGIRLPFRPLRRHHGPGPGRAGAAFRRAAPRCGRQHGHPRPHHRRPALAPGAGARCPLLRRRYARRAGGRRSLRHRRRDVDGRPPALRSREAGQLSPPPLRDRRQPHPPTSTSAATTSPRASARTSWTRRRMRSAT